MAEIRFETGLVSYNLNDVCEVSFNPTDSAFVERLFHTFDTLDRKQDAYKAEIENVSDRRKIFDIARERDAEMRGMIDEALGAPVCDALFGGMNVYAMADGLPVWCNLMLAVMDDRHELCERAEAYEPAHCEVHGEVPQMMYDLPTSVEIEDTAYEIRSDYRAALDICAALGPVPLGRGPGACDTRYLYPGFADMPPEHYQEAIRQCFGL